MLPSHWEGLRTAYLGPRAEWNLKILGKYKDTRLSNSFQRRRKNRTKVVPLPAGTTIGTVELLGGKKGVSVRTGSSSKRRTHEVKIWRE